MNGLVLSDKDYNLTCISQCLIGEEQSEEFYVWKGHQDRNGKQITRDIVIYTFGEYFDIMDIDYLCKTKHQSHANAADEVMARKKNCRIVITSEAEYDTEIRTNNIKRCFSEESIQCREQYGKLFSFVPKFKLFIRTNYDISFKGTDSKAIQSRLRTQIFPNSLLDNDLKEPKYRIAFFHILKKYYYDWVNNGRKMVLPPNVKEQTTLLLLQNDPITPFFSEIVIKVDDSKIYVKTSELYQAFKRFYLGDPKNVNAQDFKAGMLDKGLKVFTLSGYTIYRNVEVNEEKLREIEDESKKGRTVNFDDLN